MALIFAVWVVYEQVFSAALDICDHDLATKCLNPLKVQFPKSSRVSLLIGTMHEAKGKQHEL